MKTIPQSIKVENNFSKYTTITDKNKKIKTNELVLSIKNNHNDYEIGEVKLFHESLDDKITLTMQGKTQLNHHFSFVVIDWDFMNEACFRFDASGPAHNNLEDTPLKARKIQTPHFHKYNNRGILIAYKTELVKTQEDRIRSDQNYALNHFIDEGNIVVESGDLSIVREHLHLTTKEEFDPLQGVSFDE